MGTEESDSDREKCPEAYCGLEMNSEEELKAHLMWDHNRSEFEAEKLLDNNE